MARLLQQDELRAKSALIRNVQEFYRQFETDETKRRLNWLRELAGYFRSDGIEATFLAAGSIAFGMAEKDSDYDIIYAGNTNWYGTGDGSICGLSHLHPILVTELSRISGRLVKVCEEWMNWETDLSVVRKQLQRSRWISENVESHVSMFYQLVHVNRAIDTTLDETVRMIDALRMTSKRIDSDLRLDNYVPDHYGDSFKKYHKRLKARGITIPMEVLETEAQLVPDWERMNYLRTSAKYCQN